MTRPIGVAITLIAIVGPFGARAGGVAAAATSTPLRPSAPITAVTTYPDRALVTRTARVDLAAGTSEVVLEGLPGALVDASVRATGKGAVPVKILGVEVSQEHLAKPDDARVRALQAQIHSLRDADRLLQDEVRSVQALERYLQAVQSRSAEPPKEVQVHRIDVDGIRGIFAFLAEGLNGLSKRQRDAEAARRELQDRLEKLQRDLHQLEAPASLERKVIAVGLEANRPGPFELQVTYMVPGAAWTPAYEARALLESKEVELTYAARVTQQTGEAWEAVALALSTARPAVGGRAPELQPWTVRFLPRPQVSQVYGYSGATPAAVAAPPTFSVPVARMAPEPPLEVRGPSRVEVRQEPAVPATADLATGGPAAVFKIARPASIPNDNRQHKTTVAVNRLKGEFSYLAVPKSLPFAYLVARVTATGDGPLLAGPVEVFMGADYIGRSQLDTTAPGQTFDLHLGVDEGIRVRREELPRESGESGVFNKTRRERIAYQIEVENFKPSPETITVMDQLPVAQDQEIEVGNLRLSVEPSERTEKGVLKWRLNLNPKEKKVIRVEFTVAYPPDRQILGM